MNELILKAHALNPEYAPLLDMHLKMKIADAMDEMGIKPGRQSHPFSDVFEAFCRGLKRKAKPQSLATSANKSVLTLANLKVEGVQVRFSVTLFPERAFLDFCKDHRWAASLDLTFLALPDVERLVSHIGANIATWADSFEQDLANEEKMKQLKKQKRIDVTASLVTTLLKANGLTATAEKVTFASDASDVFSVTIVPDGLPFRIYLKSDSVSLAERAALLADKALKFKSVVDSALPLSFHYSADYFGYTPSRLASLKALVESVAKKYDADVSLWYSGFNRESYSISVWVPSSRSEWVGQPISVSASPDVVMTTAADLCVKAKPFSDQLVAIRSSLPSWLEFRF